MLFDGAVRSSVVPSDWCVAVRSHNIGMPKYTAADSKPKVED